MAEKYVIGIDLGATNIRGAKVDRQAIGSIASQRIHNGTEEEVLQDVYELTDRLIGKDVEAIGIGVPSVVDVEEGIVYDVVYIPSWKEVHLKKLMEARYGIPVFVNNDANCFALGEHYFGKGKNVSSMVGLTLGTGVGGGVIVNHKLYAGRNCGAGEFGCVEYLENTYEYYCSGSFFSNVYGLDGQQVYERAMNGETEALRLYEEYGRHLGNAIKMVIYTYDPPLVILGGSVRVAFPFFEKAMWERIRTCLFTKSSERLQVQVSDLGNSGILGAAALFYDSSQ